MAAALSEGDTPEQHAADTVAAGAGLVDAAMARLLTEEGPAAVRALADLGAPFDRTADGGFVQSLEAAHGRPRIARVKGDQAGRSIMEAVTARVLAARHVDVRVGWRLRGLLQDASGRVRGVVAEHGGRTTEITAAATVLATGGVGGLYAVTTTPAELIRRRPGAGGAWPARSSPPTPSSSSSTPPPWISAATRRRWRPKPCGARARSWWTATGAGSWTAITPTPSWRRAMWWRARSRPNGPRGAAHSWTPARPSARRSRRNSPPSSPPAWRAGSIRAASRSRWRRPATTHMGGIATDAHGRRPRSGACSPPASAPRRACTGPIAWRPTRWSRPRCSEPAPAQPQPWRSIREPHPSSGQRPPPCPPPRWPSCARP